MQEAMKVYKESPSIQFAWSGKPGEEQRTLVMDEEGFHVDGDLTTDLERVLSAIKDFDAYITENDPDLLTAEIAPEEFWVEWKVEDRKMMRFDRDGTIFLMGKIVDKDVGLVARIAAWVQLHKVKP